MLLAISYHSRHNTVAFHAAFLKSECCKNEASSSSSTLLGSSRSRWIRGNLGILGLPTVASLVSCKYPAPFVCRLPDETFIPSFARFLSSQTWRFNTLQDAKIGIFIHWGVFSVPSFGSEWFWESWATKKTQDYEVKVHAQLTFIVDEWQPLSYVQCCSFYHHRRRLSTLPKISVSPIPITRIVLVSAPCWSGLSVLPIQLFLKFHLVWHRCDTLWSKILGGCFCKSRCPVCSLDQQTSRR